MAWFILKKKRTFEEISKCNVTLDDCIVNLTKIKNSRGGFILRDTEFSGSIIFRTTKRDKF